MNRRKIHPGEVLARLMAQRGIKSANELSRLTGVPQPTVTRILNKESEDPENATLEKFARYFRLSTAHIRGEAGPYNVETGPAVHPIPVVSWAEAGKLQPPKASDPTSDDTNYVYTTREIGPRAYALRNRGDSMENPGGKTTFPERSIIIVDPEKTPNIGDFVVARFKDQEEATFKQLAEDAGRRFLKPLNPRYPIIPIDNNVILCGTWVQTIINNE